MKKLFSLLILVCLTFFLVTLCAETQVLEAKDYPNYSVQDFLNHCKSQNKNAYFNKGVYTLSSDLNVVNGVDIIGEEGTIFQSKDKQRYIYDIEDVKNITIEHIIFDNVTIWCQRQNSTGWTIRQNIFLNARDVDVSMGCKPDSYGKNGGPATGYYIQNKRGAMQILSNMFLRNSASLGRGVATYYTNDVIIKDNFFGRLEDVEKSIVSTETKKLKEVALNSGLVDIEEDYGYFMTGINILNSDVNAKIIGNYMSFNTHIKEAGYEDGSQSTNGYNRDHFVYAKAFLNLEIVGNYFKGMNKNQDGGVKCRNGEGLLIYKNVLEDSLILLYVQDDATGAILKNVDIRENIFINKDFTTKLVKIPYGNNQELSKYLTVDYSILFLNYKQNAEVDSITISSNLFCSNGLANEQIRIDNKDKTYDVPTNIYIENNKNYLGEYARITTRNFKDLANIDVKSDWNNGVEYVATLTEEYKDFNVQSIANICEISYELTDDGKLLTSAEKVYVDGKIYENQSLTIGKKYFLFLIHPSTSSILVEEQIEEGIPSFLYTALEVEVGKKGYEISFNMNQHGTQIKAMEDMSALPSSLPTPTEEGWKFEGWYLDAEYESIAIAGSTLTNDIVLYAKWTQNTYLVCFQTDGGSLVMNQTILYGQKASIPNLPVKEGYIFIGWYQDINKTILYDFDLSITSDRTLYAKWKKITYAITFDTQGYGTKPESIEVEEKLPLLLPILEQDGWKFEGWYLDSTYLEKIIPGQEIHENMTLYAKWTEIKFTVYFADVDISPISVKQNETINQPESPTKEGYIFMGWYKEKTCQTPWDFTVDKVTKNTTLYPKWKKEEITYEVYFDSNGGSFVTSISGLQNGSFISKPQNPVREGYTFIGWYKDIECLEEWKFEEDVVSNNFTLYAKWEKVVEPSEKNSSDLVTILSVSISIGVGILGLCFLMILVIRKKRTQ